MSETQSESSRRQSWERVTGIPLMVLAVIFLGVYALQVLDTGASPQLESWLTRVDVVIWVAFALDFAVRLALADNRWRFLRTHPVDLLIVVLPPFRPLRLLRAAMLVIGTLNRNTATRARLAVFVGVSSVLVLLLCSLAFFDVEYGAPDSKIHNFGDALWWSMVSVTTVGYGDVYPVTTEGRLISLVLMTFGIGLISFAIGTTTSWVMDQLRSVEANVETADREIGELVTEIRSLRAEVAELRAIAHGPLDVTAR
ncbi:potassium channel family protein [Nocardia arizonensis]|uniref:potassium channel family protein n=1 Tax=Nocardia arizonensis TaxID=1141647 RepID=UPI0006CFCB91|nr:potassium channel family protein [Nocardia arizonensis]